MSIYLDNAATAFPKLKCVIEAMRLYFEEVGANCGRSAHKQSQEASRIVFETRERVAQLIGAKDASRIIFTSNATEGLNTAIFGLLDEGDGVITSSMEHNSVMRPLRHLEETRSVKINVVPCSSKGELDPDDLGKNISRGTKLIVLTAASNVAGTLMPVHEVAEIAREHDIPFLLDAAQTVGCVPLDVETERLDIVAFSGHKGILGPQGTGCLYIREGIDIQPLRFGGTGSRSEFEFQPVFSPDRFESGTLNIIGLAGLGAAVKYLLQKGVNTIRAQEQRLTHSLSERLSQMKGVILYGPRDPKRQTGLISINVDTLEPSEVGYKLDTQYDIAVRVGLHCSPAAHRTLGTFPQGTVRISPGPFNTEDDIEALCTALEEIAAIETKPAS